jgi:hemin uptake protein HemP
MNQLNPATPPDPGSSPPGAPGPPRIRSDDLLHGQREILIEHQGEIYRLSVTRSGKLILHK